MGDNSWNRGFNFVDWCIMCCCCGETIDHLLLHCKRAHQLWSFVFRSFEICGFYQDRLQIYFLIGGVGWEVLI